MKKGFTLIELFLVLVIVGILASLGFVRYLDVMERGRMAEAKVVLNQIWKAEEIFFARRGVLTNTISDLDIGAIPQGGCSSSHYFSYGVFIQASPIEPTINDLVLIADRCTGGGKPPQLNKFKGFDSYTMRLRVDRVSSSAVGQIIYDCCFLSGTPILLADGTSKAIETLKKGDTVMAFDEANKKFIPDKVKRTYSQGSNSYLIINDYLKVTPSHPFYSKGKWIKAGKLKLGDNLLNAQGKPQAVFSIQQIKKKNKVYNIETDKYHNFIAGNILVHNKICKIIPW